MSSRRRIIIIDDSDAIRQAAADVLEKAGWQVLMAERAFGTGALILKERPDAVLLDVNMPGLRGHDLVQLIRKTPSIAQTPVVLHSSEPEETLAVLASRCGATGYICKGKIETLPAVLDRVLSAAAGEA